MNAGINTTICITTLNRPKFVERLLSYYADQNFAGELLIGDSSSQTIYCSIEKSAQKHKKRLRVRTFSLPHLHQAAVMDFLAREVTTEFAAYSGDDDYIIPSGMNICEQFLFENNDYVAAHGSVIAINSNGVTGIPTSVDPSYLPSPSDETALNRIQEFYKLSGPSIFSLHRVAVWKRLFSENENVKDKAFGAEIIPSVLSAALGKTAELRFPYLVRQIHPMRYSLSSHRHWILSQHFLSSCQNMLDQLEEILMLKPEDVPEEVKANNALSETLWNAWMEYLCKGYGQCRTFLSPSSSKPALRTLIRDNPAQYLPVLRSLAGFQPQQESALPTILINWGNPYVFQDALGTSLLPLSRYFRIVLLAVDFRLTNEIRLEFDRLKNSGIIEDVIVAPSHGGTASSHLFMREVSVGLANYNFAVLLSISAMQPYERYLTDWILNEDCLRIVLWPHPTNVFLYPDLVVALKTGERNSINHSVSRIRRKIQPRVWLQLLRPSITSLRLIGFFITWFLFRRCKYQTLPNLFEVPMCSPSLPSNVTPRIVKKVVGVRQVFSYLGKDTSAFDLTWSAWAILMVWKNPVIRAFVKGRSRFFQDVILNFLVWADSIDAFIRRPLGRYWKPETEFLNHGLWVMGLDPEELMRKYSQFVDRILLPIMIFGKPIPFQRLDCLTQIGTHQMDATLFFSQDDADIHNKLYGNDRFFAVRPSSCDSQRSTNKFNAVLMPFSVHEERDFDGPLFDIYCRDLMIVINESGVEEIHLRPHPGRNDPWLAGLVTRLSTSGVPIILVEAKGSLGDVAKGYAGVFGAVSGSLRDARLSSKDIFVIGSMGLSLTHFSDPKSVVGFAESIGWIESDGTYDPMIFRARPHADQNEPPSLVEKIVDLFRNREALIKQSSKRRRAVW